MGDEGKVLEAGILEKKLSVFTCGRIFFPGASYTSAVIGWPGQNST